MHSIIATLRGGSVRRWLVITMVLLVSAAGPAEAGSRRGGKGGRLGRVVGGIRSSGGSHGGSRGGGRSPSRGHGHGHLRGYSTAGLGWSPTAGVTLVRPTVDIYGGVQRVVDSDGSITGELRVAWSRIALLGRISGYRESAGPGQPPTELGLAAAGVGFELTGDRDGKVWLEGLGAALRTAPPDSLLGVAGGLRAELRLDRSLTLFGAVRRYAFASDVRATEAIAGVQAWFLRASYRVMDFNVGPALRGPELGVALRF